MPSLPSRTVDSRQDGFGAAVAVTMLALGALAMSLAAMGAATAYSDSVSLRERRIRRGLEEKACADARALIAAKDTFASGTVYVPAFDCKLSF